ncbi:uncharacterized protein Tco025E_00121 [Trypanosoma conorhini]|uniref:Uncharacterized protein n=1 Tax=Trypanosoma conorhini TaxID=83891 RepID=A0A422QCP2_9TRYP|nr:uncharacterized protein Tco025E_00121 [Trypanosoma conorhini]RNF27737.1 hypothetical protein Tco025E_00121 [Trypanosoma conorhini]
MGLAEARQRQLHHRPRKTANEGDLRIPVVAQHVREFLVVDLNHGERQRTLCVLQRLLLHVLQHGGNHAVGHAACLALRAQHCVRLAGARLPVDHHRPVQAILDALQDGPAHREDLLLRGGGGKDEVGVVGLVVKEDAAPLVEVQPNRRALILKERTTSHRHFDVTHFCLHQSRPLPLLLLTAPPRPRPRSHTHTPAGTERQPVRRCVRNVCMPLRVCRSSPFQGGAAQQISPARATNGKNQKKKKRNNQTRSKKEQIKTSR